LESILRIAYFKKDNDDSNDKSGKAKDLKATLETMLGNAKLDIKKRATNDKILENMLDLADQGFFEDNFDLFAAIFTEKGTYKD